jgi:hypothetical protein
MVQHYPDTPYAKRARDELKKLSQPVDNEEDPLKLVLAENGYGETVSDIGENVQVRQRDQGPDLSGASGAYGSDDLPNLGAAAPAPPAHENTQVASTEDKGPATLRTIRLSASNPPMSVIFDLSRPVKYEQHIENGPGYSTVKVLLKGVTPEASVQSHVVFDRSIFKDCDVTSDDQGTTITVNTVPVSSFAVVPLTEPPRLLVTFTPQGSASN